MNIQQKRGQHIYTNLSVIYKINKKKKKKKKASSKSEEATSIKSKLNGVNMEIKE